METVVTYFITFIFYAFLGWCFEMVHMSLTTKEVVNRGFYNGPIVPIYAVGGLLIVILLDSIKSNILLTVVLITLICCVTEYITSLIMEKLFKIRWWDYSDKKFNLNGRICLETMIMFVVMAVGVLYFIHPVFLNFIDKFSRTQLNIIAVAFLALFLIDNIVSFKIVNKFLKQGNTGKRKDKTPLIRQYTKTLMKDWL